jgi:glycosyltransferase involved in cell wall biosynthesis
MQDKNPIVSVLMTAYNREKYIAEAIESVLASIFDDFELIIVDDCSSDKTVEIARQFEVNDNRVKVFVNEKNLGDYPNRNRAASYATGKYIKYVDSDDKIYKYGLSILVESMEQFPSSNIGFATMPMLDKIASYPIELNSLESNRFHFIKKIGVFSNGPLSAIIRTDFFTKMGGFSSERMVSDFKFWLDSSLKGSIVLIQDGIVWNRVHPGQELRDVLKYEERYFQIEQKHISKLKTVDVSLFKQIQNQLLKSYLKSTIKLALGLKIQKTLRHLKYVYSTMNLK